MGRRKKAKIVNIIYGSPPSNDKSFVCRDFLSYDILYGRSLIRIYLEGRWDQDEIDVSIVLHEFSEDILTIFT